MVLIVTTSTSSNVHLCVNSPTGMAGAISMAMLALHAHVQSFYTGLLVEHIQFVMEPAFELGIAARLLARVQRLLLVLLEDAGHHFFDKGGLAGLSLGLAHQGHW